MHFRKLDLRFGKRETAMDNSMFRDMWKLGNVESWNRKDL